MLQNRFDSLLERVRRFEHPAVDSSRTVVASEAASYREKKQGFVAPDREKPRCMEKEI